MAQKWYKNSAVQAAIVVGIFGLLTAIATGIFSIYQDQKPLPVDKANTQIADTEVVQRLKQVEDRIQQLEEVAGIYCNEKVGIVALIGRESYSEIPIPLTIEDLAFSLRLAKLSDKHSIGCNFEQSIDGLNVHFTGGIENTHLGFVLFKADIALKEYSLGKQFGGEVVQSSLTIYGDILKRVQESTNKPSTKLGRFWLSGRPRLQVSNNLAVVKETGIFVSVEEMIMQSRELASRAATKDTTLKSVAQFLTTNYQNIAREDPSFAAFTRIVQIIAVSKWLVQSKLINEIDWLDYYIAKDTTATPIRIPQIRVKHEQTDETDKGILISSIIQIAGGVSLDIEPLVTFTTDNQSVEIENKINEKINSVQTGSVFEVKISKENYVCLVLCAR